MYLFMCALRKEMRDSKKVKICCIKARLAVSKGTPKSDREN